MAALRHVFISIAVASIVSMAVVLAIPTPTFAQTPTPTPTPVMPEMPDLGGERGAFLVVLVFLAVVSTLTNTVNVVFFSVVSSILVGYAYQAVWVGLVVWLAAYGMRIIKNLAGG